ncbi:MAG: hypothetical protein U0031_17650 [Thermomicrobiales bacterium]
MNDVFSARKSVATLVALFAISLIAPVGAQVVDQDNAAVEAPALPSWDEYSGYGAVEGYRASLATASASWDASSGYGVVERTRALRAPAVGADFGLPRNSRINDLGSLQEEYLAARAAADELNDFPYK